MSSQEPSFETTVRTRLLVRTLRLDLDATNVIKTTREGVLAIQHLGTQNEIDRRNADSHCGSSPPLVHGFATDWDLNTRATIH
jgi:hypothetical protein